MDTVQKIEYYDSHHSHEVFLIVQTTMPTLEFSFDRFSQLNSNRFLPYIEQYIFDRKTTDFLQKFLHGLYDIRFVSFLHT